MTLYSPDASQRASIYTPAFDPNNNAFTIGVLWVNNLFQGSMLWQTWQPANFNHRSAFFDGAFYGYFDAGYGSYGTGTTVWRWYVITTSAATSAQRYHIAEYASSGALTWTHVNPSSGSGVTAQSAADRITIGDPFGSGVRGSWMVLAGFEREMSDAEVEATFERSSAQIMAESPDFFAHWPEADGVVFEDIAGGGTEKVSERTGTWQVTADPTGYDASLGGGGRSGLAKVWDGSAWNQHPAKVWSGSAWVTYPMKGFNGTDWITAK